MPLSPQDHGRQDSGCTDPVDALCERVLRRFSRAYPMPVAVARMDGRGQVVRVNGVELPHVHPTCQACRNHPECPYCSQARLASDQGQPGCCPAGHLICFVPLRREGELVAVYQLVEPGRIPRASVNHRVELLARLIAESTSCAAGGSNGGEAQRAARRSPLGPHAGPEGSRMHPQVRRAIDYIQGHLADSRTNVAGVARALGVNSTYLSHIFAEETGVRMSRYIASRRIQLAKELLASTEWQIKRVAFESGHSNADWFSQVFHAYAGMTPCAYRNHARSSVPSGQEAVGG